MTDRKITITIPKKKKPKRSNGGDSLHRGPIRTERKSEYLSRRRKAGGLIRFFDLGRTAAGNERDFGVQPGTLSPGEFPMLVQEYKDANWQTHVRDVLLSLTDDLAGYCHQIGYEEMDTYSPTLIFADGDEQNVTIGTGDERWTEGGLVLEGPLNYFQLSGWQSLGYDIDDTAENIKITSSPSYDAAAVSFSPSNSMDVFLAPVMQMVCVSTIVSTLYIFGGGYYNLIPRSVIAGTATFNDLLSAIQAHSMYRSDTQIGGGTSTPGGTITTVPPATNGNASFGSINNLYLSAMSVPQGGLMGIIVKGGTKYYFWANEDIDYAGSGYPFYDIDA